MRGMNWLAERAAAFAGDRRGNFALIAAAVAPTLVMSVGFGVNVAQSYQLRSSLQNALDAAVTSTARDLTTGKTLPGDANASVTGFLAANTDAKFSVQKSFVLDSLTVDRTARTISATASADVAIAFPLFSMLAPHVRVDSAALYSDKSVEVAMMLDVTGSMKGGKISDLKTAATNAVTTLLGSQDPARPRVRIALVPYAEAVNVGKLSTSSVFVERTGGPDLPPAIDDPISAGAGSRPDDCATERKYKDGTADATDDGPTKQRTNNAGKIYLAKVNRDDRLEVCPTAAMIPLTADKSKLVASIDGFRADGVTAGNIGVQWGYYMLSPKWRATVSSAGLGNGPADRDDRRLAKVAILMTDGQFNTAFAGFDPKQNARRVRGAQSRSHAQALCDNMKSDGIQIFTIGFDLDNRSMSATERNEAKAVLKNCASATKNYFEAATGKELDSAFQEIAGNIEALVLTR